MQKKQFVIKGVLFGLFGIVAFSSSVFADCTSDCAKKYGVIVPAYATCVKACPTATSTTKTNTKAQCESVCGKTNSTCLNSCLGTTNANGNGVTSKGPSVDSCAAQGMEYAVMTNSCVKNQTKIASCVSSECQNFEGTQYTACEAKCSANPSYITPISTGYTDPADQRVRGITMGPKCLKNGQCGFNIYEFLGFEGKSNDPTVFVQDILLSASFFIGTVITIALIYSGFLFVTAGISGNSKNADSAKNGIKYSIIGLLIVICSYSLIRLVQYIAKGL